MVVKINPHPSLPQIQIGPIMLALCYLVMPPKFVPIILKFNYASIIGQSSYIPAIAHYLPHTSVMMSLPEVSARGNMYVHCAGSQLSLRCTLQVVLITLSGYV